MGCGHSGRGSGSPWTPRRRRCTPARTSRRKIHPFHSWEVGAIDVSLPLAYVSTTQPCNPPSRYIDIQPFHHRHQTLLNIVVSVRALCANVNVFGVSRILVWLRRKYQLFPIISIYRTILCILNIFNIYFIAILERDTLKMSSRDEWNCNNICMCHTSYK